MAQASAPKRELSRHVTPDGRNSLWKHLFGKREPGAFSEVAHKARPLVPLFAAVAGGIALAAWFGTRHLAKSPDVRIDKLARASSIRENQAEGAKWVKHHESMRGLSTMHLPKPAEQQKPAA